MQKVLVVRGQGNLALATDVKIPEPGLGEVLIRVAAVALNPSDIKHLDYTPVEGAVCGSDLAGTVIKIGGEVQKEIATGDRVSTLVFGCNPNRPQHGAFADYVVAQSELCVKLPQNMSFEEGATFGVGLVTTGLALKSLGLVNQQASGTTSPGEYVLVCGGSTATGTRAIQTLKLLGHIPLATCSPHNFNLVVDAGAVRAFDYHSSTCARDIRGYTDGKLTLAMDCIGERGSTAIAYGAIGLQGGKYISTSPIARGLRLRRKKVQPDWILGYTVFGQNVELGGNYAVVADPEDKKFAAFWMSRMEEMLAAGQLQPHPIKTQPDGLLGIIRDLDLIRDGAVSGKKLVYSLGQ